MDEKVVQKRITRSGSKGGLDKLGKTTIISKNFVVDVLKEQTKDDEEVTIIEETPEQKDIPLEHGLLKSGNQTNLSNLTEMSNSSLFNSKEQEILFQLGNKHSQQIDPLKEHFLQQTEDEESQESQFSGVSDVLFQSEIQIQDIKIQEDKNGSAPKPEQDLPPLPDSKASSNQNSQSGKDSESNSQVYQQNITNQTTTSKIVKSYDVRDIKIDNVHSLATQGLPLSVNDSVQSSFLKNDHVFEQKDNKKLKGTQGNYPYPGPTTDKKQKEEDIDSLIHKEGPLKLQQEAFSIKTKILNVLTLIHVSMEKFNIDFLQKYLVEATSATRDLDALLTRYENRDEKKNDKYSEKVIQLNNVKEEVNSLQLEITHLKEQNNQLQIENTNLKKMAIQERQDKSETETITKSSQGKITPSSMELERQQMGTSTEKTEPPDWKPGFLSPKSPRKKLIQNNSQNIIEKQGIKTTSNYPKHFDDSKRNIKKATTSLWELLSFSSY